MSNLGAAVNDWKRTISISRMTEHDLLEVVEIEEASGLSRWGWDAYHAELTRKTETIMLVARHRSSAAFRLAGFIAARIAADDLHINNMAVRVDWRRRGIGGLLLRAALDDGKRAGARRAFLEVRATNETAQQLYRKYGFTSTARRASYYMNPPEDALVMTARLDEL